MGSIFIGVNRWNFVLPGPKVQLDTITNCFLKLSYKYFYLYNILNYHRFFFRLGHCESIKYSLYAYIVFQCKSWSWIFFKTRRQDMSLQGSSSNYRGTQTIFLVVTTNTGYDLTLWPKYTRSKIIQIN
jgi:hypothetical protein